MMAATLMAENAYSTAPYTFTLRRFTPTSTAENTPTQIHCGTAGNQ